MATISDNKKGNPYHDEEGKFTSESGNNSSSKQENNVKVKLKQGVNLGNLINDINNSNNNNIPNNFATYKVDVNFSLTMPTSIQDAEAQGNRILGSNDIVGYASNTDLEVANEFNKSLLDVCKDFPEFFSNQQLYLYGTEDKRKYDNDIRSDEQSLIKSVLSMPVYSERLKKLGMNIDGIMDTMTLSLHNAKKTFRDDPEKGCGGFTQTSDFDNTHHVLNTHNVIKFNTHYSEKMQKWDMYPKFSIATGHFLPIGDKTGAYMVAVHELGHHVFEKLVDLMDDNEVDQLKSLVCDKKLNSQLLSKREISVYATTSRHEHIAECFANVYCAGDKASNHNKNVFSFLKQVYNRIYGNK